MRVLFGRLDLSSNHLPFVLCVRHTIRNEDCQTECIIFPSSYFSVVVRKYTKAKELYVNFKIKPV